MNSLLVIGATSEVSFTVPRFSPTKSLFLNKNSTISQNWSNNWAKLCPFIWTVFITICYSHVTYAFQSESTLYIWQNFKELLAQSRSKIWSVSDCNGTRTNKNLVGKQKLKNFAKLTKLLSWFMSTYLYGWFWLYVIVNSRTHFRVNPHSIFAWM